MFLHGHAHFLMPIRQQHAPRPVNGVLACTKKSAKKSKKTGKGADRKRKKEEKGAGGKRCHTNFHRNTSSQLTD
jgi:hypothetical protein